MILIRLHLDGRNKKLVNTSYYGLKSVDSRADQIVHNINVGLISETTVYPEKELKYDYILLIGEINLKPILISRIYSARKQILINLNQFIITPLSLSKLDTLFRKKIKLCFIFEESLHVNQAIPCIEFLLSKCKTNMISPIKKYSRLFEDV